MSEQKKEFDYATKIMLALSEILTNEEQDFFIDAKDEGFDMTAFVYAVGTVAPAMIYQRLTNDNRNFLEFNHLQNQLCFQYLNTED